MEGDFTFSAEDSDDEDIIPYMAKRVKGRKKNRKGNPAKEDESSHRSNIGQKGKKPKGKLKALAHASGIAMKTNRKKIKYKEVKKIASKGLVKGKLGEENIKEENTSWEHVDVTDEGDNIYGIAREVENFEKKSDGSLHKAYKRLKTTSLTVDWALNPRRKKGELKPRKPIKKKVNVKEPVVDIKQNYYGSMRNRVGCDDDDDDVVTVMAAEDKVDFEQLPDFEHEQSNQENIFEISEDTDHWSDHYSDNVDSELGNDSVTSKPA